MNPLISIVTAVRNQQRFLPQLLESIGRQKALNFEHVIIEGESTDNSLSLIDDYVHNYGTKFPIQVFTYPPKGISDAMNKGIDHAKGDWIIVVQGDDYLEDENSTKRMAEVIGNNSNSSWIIGNSVRNYWGIQFNTHTYPFRPLQYRLLLHEINLLPHQNMLMKRELFNRYGYFIVEMKTHMDAEFYVRLFSEGVFPTAVNTSFAVMRRHFGAESVNPQVFLHASRQLSEHVRIAKQRISWNNPSK